MQDFINNKERSNAGVIFWILQQPSEQELQVVLSTKGKLNVDPTWPFIGFCHKCKKSDKITPKGKILYITTSLKIDF